MKAVLISIRPKWCELIASGKKTIEVRKTRPKMEPPFKCYIYCTKPSKAYQTICGCMVLNSDELFRHPREGIKYGDSIELMAEDDYTKDNFLNGKVIGEFVCDEMYKDIVCGKIAETDILCLTIQSEHVRKSACLSEKELYEYSNGKHLYGWHISDLVIYDKPKEPSEFHKSEEKPYDIWHPISRPPQSWMYVEELV